MQMPNYQKCTVYANGQTVCTVQPRFEYVVTPSTPPIPPTVTEQAQAMWFTYWPWIIAAIFWCFACLVMRGTGRTDLTVNHYETYEGYEVNDPSEDDDE